jgi:hypothetical protein
MSRNGIQQFRREEAERERQEKQARDQRIQKELNKLQELDRERVQLERERLLSIPLSDEELGDVDRIGDEYFIDTDGLDPDTAANVRDSLVAKFERDARDAAEDFVASEPRFLPCPESYRVLTQFMILNDLKPTVHNFQRAFNALYNVGLLPRHPEASVEPQPTTSHDPQSVDVEAGFSAQEIARMSADEYRQRVLAPAFAAVRKANEQRIW